MLPTSRLIAPTEQGSRESLDGTNTGSKDEKQTADEDDSDVDTEQLLELGEGCGCESPVPKVMMESLFAHAGGGAVPKSLMATEAELSSGPTVGPLETTGSELQGTFNHVSYMKLQQSIN